MYTVKINLTKFVSNIWRLKFFYHIRYAHTKFLNQPIFNSNSQIKITKIQKFWMFKEVLHSHTNKLNEIIHLTRHSKTLYENIWYGKKTLTLVYILLLYLYITLIICISFNLLIYNKQNIFYEFLIANLWFFYNFKLNLPDFINE